MCCFVLQVANQDVESGEEPRYVILGARAQRVSTATTVCLFLTALLVMSIGIISGVYLYRQFARSQMHRFRGMCNIPYYTGSNKIFMRDDDDQIRHEPLLTVPDYSDGFPNKIINNGMAESQLKENFFKQGFELDLETESYEKIDVPDFGGGRKGRFIHDFNTVSVPHRIIAN